MNATRLPASCARAGGEAVRGLGVGLVPEVPLEVEHLCPRDELVVDIGRAELGRRAEVRVHGALRVGRDHDEAATAGLAAGRGLGQELDAGGADVVAEHRAELVVGHPADERRAAAERRDPDQRVGRRAAGDLDRGPHRRVEVLGALGVDQLHRPGREVVRGEELVLLVAEHVDQRVPDGDDVETIAHDHPLVARRAGPLRPRSAANRNTRLAVAPLTTCCSARRSA